MLTINPFRCLYLDFFEYQLIQIRAIKNFLFKMQSVHVVEL